MALQALQAMHTKADALKSLRAYGRQLGDKETPTLRGYEKFQRRNGDVSVEELKLLYGSWIEAARAAGLRLPGRPSSGTRAEVIRSLKRAADEIGVRSGGALRLRKRDYLELSRKRDDLVSMRAVLRIFGSWAKACEAAGLAAMRPARVERSAALEEAAIEVLARGGASPARWNELRGGLPTARRIAGAYNSWRQFVRRVENRAAERA